jgi:hypothetical protein
MMSAKNKTRLLWQEDTLYRQPAHLCDAHQMLLWGSPSLSTYWKDREQSSSWARRNISRWL